ncbi:MAG TPA: FUSC family protein [Terracidiphilus sp.]
MRLNTSRTRSQQELAMKLGVQPVTQVGLLTWERKRLLIHAAKTALAATLCWWLALRFGLHDGYWGAISAIIVLQSNVGATISASRDRIVGTIIGAGLGFTFSLFGSVPWNYVCAVFAAIIVCGLLGFRSSSRLAGVTITIIMLVQSNSRKALAFDRVLQVVLGIVIAVIVITVVFPDRARLALRDGLAQESLLLGSFFEAILSGFRGARAESIETLRADALALLRGNNQLLQAARNEPSGGPGWREGLALLAESERAIFDSLVALELAIKDSAGDGYAEQLEPMLGNLANDIHSGFHYVAGCIHKWQFNVPPPNLHLEEDIALLEQRMAQLRHKGREFSQAEILRAYAVQLHLKQLARLLRAARVETSRAVGQIQAT